MKAPTYQEACKRLAQNYYQFPKMSGPDVGKLLEFVKRQCHLNDFYGQAFTPEMLTGEKAIFAGWGLVYQSGKKIVLWKFDSEHVEFCNRGNLPGGYAVDYLPPSPNSSAIATALESR